MFTTNVMYLIMKVKLDVFNLNSCLFVCLFVCSFIQYLYFGFYRGYWSVSKLCVVLNSIDVSKEPSPVILWAKIFLEGQGTTILRNVGKYNPQLAELT